MARAEELRERTPSERALTERVLKATYTIILPSILRREVRGFAACTIATERSWDYYVQLAADLGVWTEELIHNQDPISKSLRRVERQHLEEAAVELCEFVRIMPPPVRVVVEARACGVAWKKMTEQLPGRAFFSIREDWYAALATILRDRKDLVRRISF